MLPIVIVDDSREDALLAERVLVNCRIKNPVTLLHSGADCLAYFSGNEPFENRRLPCLLLLDLVMSPMTGLQVLTELEGIRGSRDSVLVMLSGLRDWRAIHAGYQKGAHTFLVKPLQPEDVIQMLHGIPALTVESLVNGYEIKLSPDPSISADEMVTGKKNIFANNQP